MKSRHDNSSFSYNLKLAFEKYNQSLQATRSILDVFFNHESTRVEFNFLLVLRELAKKERLSDADLYKITKTIIEYSYYTDPAYQEFFRELINQIGQDTLDFFKVLIHEDLFKEADFKDVISNPDLNRIKDIVLDPKTTNVHYCVRKDYIAMILEIAKQGIFSNALFEENFVSSLIDEIYRAAYKISSLSEFAGPILNETFISQKLIELYLKNIGNFRLEFEQYTSIKIEKAIFYIKIIDLIRKKDGFSMRKVVKSLTESIQYNTLKPFYIIFNYLNKNNLLNYSNYKFFTSSNTCSKSSVQSIAKLIDSNCLDGDEFSPVEMVEMIQSQQKGLFSNIDSHIINWFFENNPELLTQKNLAKILSHEHIFSLMEVISSLCSIEYLHEKNSLKKCQLVRLKDNQSGNEFFEMIKNSFNVNPVYLLLGDTIYYLKNNFCTTLQRSHENDISQIFPKKIGEFCLATIQNLKDITEESLNNHIQLDQEDFDEILSCPWPADAFSVIEILQYLNLLTPATKHQVLTHPHQSELSAVICCLSEHEFQLNPAQLSRIFECSSILSRHVESLYNIPNHLFNDNTVNHLLNLCLRANHDLDIQTYVTQLIGGNVNTSQEIILNSAQSTHTASVHKSVSESAIRLKTRYEKKLRKIGFEKTLNEIKSYLTSLPDDENIRVNKNSAAKRSIKNLNYKYALWTFIDPTSQISSKELLALAWIAIHDKKTCLTSLEDALASFVKSLYEIQRGYNIDKNGKNDDGQKDRTICFGGAFNKIAEGLHTIHPDIKILFITKAGANLKIQKSGIVLDLCFVYFKKKNLVIDQLKQLRNEGFESQLFKDSWPDLRQDIAKEMIEYRDAFKNDKEFDDFIENSKWALDVEELCNKIGKSAQQADPIKAQPELPIPPKDEALPEVKIEQPSPTKPERRISKITRKKAQDIQKEAQIDNEPSLLLYLCCFLDEISLPVALFIPIIGQIYFGARLANGFKTLTNEKYSFFSCCASRQANDQMDHFQLNWNFAP